MAEWNFRLRAKLDDGGNVSKMVTESLEKDWAEWDAEHPYEPHPRDSSGGSAHDAHGDSVDLHHDVPSTVSGGVKLEGPGWTKEAADNTQSGIDRVQSAFPDAPKLDNVRVVPDQQATGNKSNTNITVSPQFIDGMTARDKDFAGLEVHGGQEGIIVHEYGHVLDSNLGRDHPDEAKQLTAYLNEKMDVPGLGTITRLQDGLGAPSAYGAENRYEYVAEALSDSIFNGDNAKPTSQAVAAIFHQAYGGS
jgi:hypothetical protein